MSRTRRAARDAESGVILVNVLAVTALASIVVLTMMSLQDTSIRRSVRFAEAEQAAAYALGGETSAIVALRRDAAEAPNSDHYQEPWARLAETAVPIENGTFSLSIEDAQARFNMNVLTGGGVLAVDALRKIAVALGLPPGIADMAAAQLRAGAPVSPLDTLRQLGAEQALMDRLGNFVTVLPGVTPVNINTADEALIGILLGNGVAARILVSQRERRGFLTPAEVAAAGVVLPPGLGFTTNYFRVTTEVRIGETSQRVTSLLQRRSSGHGPEVVVVSRERGMAAPRAAPPSE